MIKIFRFLAILLLFVFSQLMIAQPWLPGLMPRPSSIKWKNDEIIYLDSAFSVVINKNVTHSVRINAALASLTKLTKLQEIPKYRTLKIVKVVEISFEKIEDLKLGMDEAYVLSFKPDTIKIRCKTDIGVARAIATISQLILDPGDVNECEIEDAPRFPWRGLLIDVSRHFMTVETIKRNIDGMAAVKLNVLHLHLSDDQGFRIECKTFPKLHQLGSNGQYFTQEQMKDIIAYADLRGVRVVPEFDLPGHATSWFASYPQFASEKKKYDIEPKFGVCDPVFDPTNDSIYYPFLDAFFKEMCALFPDAYMHIGGDENNGVQWNANPKIQQFVKDHKLDGNHGLHAYFNTKLHAILTKYGKTMMGWDEILSPDLPKDIMIQSWRGKEGMINAAKSGVPSILSNGYYLDLCMPTWKHYANDPLDENTDLTEEQKKLILGGEACMWSELVDNNTIDGRIWPRTAVIAERLWSKNLLIESTFAPDLYFNRLNGVSKTLNKIGLQHQKINLKMLSEITGSEKNESLSEVLNSIEPVKIYQRHSFRTYLTSTKLNTLPDAIAPECYMNSYIRNWGLRLNDFEFYKNELKPLSYQIENLLKTDSSKPYLKPYLPLINNLKQMCLLNISVIEDFQAVKLDKARIAAVRKEIEMLRKPVNELKIGITDDFIELLDILEKKIETGK